MQQVPGNKGTSMHIVPAATTKVVTLYDYQHELVTTWSNHLETDTSGILEKSINHGDDCKCCSPNAADSIRGRGRY
jgi:hypothetical protein